VVKLTVLDPKLTCSFTSLKEEKAEITTGEMNKSLYIFSFLKGILKQESHSVSGTRKRASTANLFSNAPVS
jgi:hypothetical protein